MRNALSTCTLYAHIAEIEHADGRGQNMALHAAKSILKDALDNGATRGDVYFLAELLAAISGSGQQEFQKLPECSADLCGLCAELRNEIRMQATGGKQRIQFI